METEEKMENKTIKGFISSHQNEIKAIAVLTGLAVLTVVSIKAGLKPSVSDSKPVELLAESVLEEGYDIWALCNSFDDKVVEFAPKLKQFIEDNGFTIMCDMI